jgi:hypothetical protein
MSQDEEFERALREDVRRLLGATDPRTRARLHRMVDEVVHDAERRARESRRMIWPLGAVAATVVAVTVGVVMNLRHESPAHGDVNGTAAAADAALLLNVENFDLLEQMEFYQWLDRQPGILDGEVADAPVAPQRS